MTILEKLKQGEGFRRIELAALVSFVLATLFLILANPNQAPTLVSEAVQSPGVTAIASAMPNQGWAPLQVYFSAYGSHSELGEIVKYEWDLDGNGVFDTEATTAKGYTSYYYTKPGLYTVTLKVTDAQGGTATADLIVNARHPASSPVDYWTVFDDSQVRRVTIELTQANYAVMWSDIEAKITVPADAVVFGERLEDIGFRFRGQFSMRMSGDKKPFKIDTDAYIEGQEYHNLRQLMFINNIGDPSMLQEKLAYDMMHFAGVNASHVCFVDLWIDFTDDDQEPVFWGIYSMVERIDRKFLASRFGRDYDHGNLYKASHAQRGPMDLIYYGPNIENYPTQGGLYAYGKMTNEEEDDYSDIVELAYVLDGAAYSSEEEFMRALEEVFNVDSFLRYMAVMNTLASWDIYPYTGNNFYLYHNPADGRIEWLPWDLTWGGGDNFPLFELEGPGLVERAPMYDKVFAVERYRLQYAAYLDLLARYWFNYENIAQQGRGYYNLIAPYISMEGGDKAFYGDTAMFPTEAFQDGWIPLAEFAGRRSTFILSELSELPLDININE